MENYSRKISYCYPINNILDFNVETESPQEHWGYGGKVAPADFKFERKKSEQMNQFNKGQTITRLIFKATIYF